MLAHSLGALRVQLDAADALLETGGDPVKAREPSNTAAASPWTASPRPARPCTRYATNPSPSTEQLAALAATDGAQLASPARHAG